MGGGVVFGSRLFREVVVDASLHFARARSVRGGKEGKDREGVVGKFGCVYFQR